MQSNLYWRSSLLKLIEGNIRFRLGLRSVESFASALRLKEFAEKGQNPSAIILTCSDSRVPTEILFDKGVGDLFVIRIAGNVVSRSIVASVEYAATVLNTPLCVVMGHTQCGAIRAAIDQVREKQVSSTENIGVLLKKINPAIKKALENREDSSTEKLLSPSVILNVRHQVDYLKEMSPTLRGLIDTQRFRIVGALYHIEDGLVSFDTNEVSESEIRSLLPEPSLGSKMFSLE